MGMSVNFTGTKTNPYAGTNKKTTKTATYVGAGLGAGFAIKNIVKNRAILKANADGLIQQGISKGVAKGAVGAGVAIGLVTLAGVGALIGKGVGKVINHFRKSDTVADSKPEKEGKEPPTIKVKGEGEFKVEPGHPKKVYKKDPETGEWEFQTAVYDGSWGKESSDEDLVTNLTKKVY